MLLGSVVLLMTRTEVQTSSVTKSSDNDCNASKMLGSILKMHVSFSASALKLVGADERAIRGKIEGLYHHKSLKLVAL